MIFEYKIEVFKKYRGLILKSSRLHPKNPFIHPFYYEFMEFSDELKWIFLYLTHRYHIGIQLHIMDFLEFIEKAIDKEVEPWRKNFVDMLTWFYLLSHWKALVVSKAGKKNQMTIFILYKPQYFLTHGKAT